MIWIDCEYCNREYLAQRSSRKYCCDSCKSMANRQRRIDEEIQRIKNEENRMVQEAVDKYMKAYNKDQETKKLREAEELRLKKEQEEKDQFEKKKLEQIEKEKQEREREIKWAKIERENEQKAELFNFLINIVNQMISNSAKPKP